MEESEPATERQLAYAKRLGISVPPDATKQRLTYLISAKTETPATRTQKECAQRLGATLEDGIFPSQTYAANAIANYLLFVEKDQKKYNVELVKYYLYSVLRYRKGESWEDPERSGIPHDQMENLTEEFMSDLKGFGAVKAQVREKDRFDLLRFGPSADAEHYSVRSQAFQKAAQYLERKLGLPSRRGGVKDRAAYNRLHRRTIDLTALPREKLRGGAGAAGGWVVLIVVLLLLGFCVHG